MVIEEVLQDQENFTVNFFVRLKLFVVLWRDGCEYHLGEICKDTVIVVFTNRIVYVVSSNHIVVEGTDYFDMLPLLFVHICFDYFVVEAVPKL